MTKKKLQDPRVHDGQMMEPVLTPRERQGKTVGFSVGRQLNEAQVHAMYIKGQPPSAAPDLVVTISGETGKGKTILRRIIVNAIMHHAGPAKYKYAAPGITGQNFKPGTDIEAAGAYRTVLIVEDPS